MSDEPETIQEIETETIVFSELGAPYTSYCLICEKATPNEDGSVDIHRIVNRWTIHKTPLPIAIQFWVAIGFKGLPTDVAVPIRILFILEDTAQVISMTEPEIISETHDMNYFLDVERFAVSTAGNYRLSVIHDNREIGRYPFVVVVENDPAIPASDGVKSDR